MASSSVSGVINDDEAWYKDTRDRSFSLGRGICDGWNVVGGLGARGGFGLPSVVNFGGRGVSTNLWSNKTEPALLRNAILVLERIWANDRGEGEIFRGSMFWQDERARVCRALWSETRNTIQTHNNYSKRSFLIFYRWLLNPAFSKISADFLLISPWVSWRVLALFNSRAPTCKMWTCGKCQFE